MQDTDLVRRLINHRQLIVNLIEMSRVLGCVFSAVYGRGQQFKVTRKIMQFTSANDFIIEQYNRNEHGYTKVPLFDLIENDNVIAMNAIDISQEKTTGFQGATVLAPIRGFHREPIVCLDFASLYPSIMRYHNLSHDTFITSVSQAESMGLKSDDYTITPNGFIFVKGTKREGILPLILTELLNARKLAKKQMVSATSSIEKSVLNGKQLALKICCNSIYGFCGAKTSAIPCVAIAASVTSFGRQMILDTKTFMKDKFSAETIYGDTDSVFVKFPNIKIGDIAGAISKGLEAEKMSNTQKNWSF
jgi:DNA polymerase delta subunit 1